MKNQNNKIITCNICRNDKSLYNDKFFICSCKQYICPLCAKSHDQTHVMIEYKDRFYKCVNHNIDFISYCKVCKMNLCGKCEIAHNNNHKIKLYKEKMPNKKQLDEIKIEIEEIIKNIKKYKIQIKILNNLYLKNMNNIIDDLDNYILLYEKINKSLDNLKNYESIENIKNFKNKKLIKDIDEFLDENIKNKHKKLIDIIYDTKK